MKNKKQFVIGVDGGGTKTEAALANLEGKILKIVKTGPSNPRNVGIKKCIFNISQAVGKVKKGKKVSSIFIGLAAVEEEFKPKKNTIKIEIFKRAPNFRGKLIIGSDQLVAFRSGTEKKDGVVIISSTGCVCHGWKKEKEAKVSGWGWLADEGSGFWVGQRGFQAAFRELDSRGPKTLITKLIFRELKLKSKEGFLRKIYPVVEKISHCGVYSKNFVRQLSLISRIVDRTAGKGDRIAKKIMVEAGEELAKSAITVIKKLNFKNQAFPIILVGGMFNSKVVSETVKKEIKKIAPKVKFIQPKVKPVIGAVKLAIENLK